MGIDISVIVPVYNREDDIKVCLTSILAQSHVELEAIIVDDGSTDGTAEAIKSFHDPRVRYFYQENAGQGKARNLGMMQARGKYIGFVDSDDTVRGDMYRRMFEAAERTGAEVVQCAIDVYNRKSRSRQMLYRVREHTVTVRDCSKYARRYFLTGRHSTEVANKLFLKSFLFDNGLFFRDTKEVFSEDMELNLRVMCYLKKIHFLPHDMYNYYLNPNGQYYSTPIERIETVGELHRGVLEHCHGNKMMEQVLKCSNMRWLVSDCADIVARDRRRGLSLLKKNAKWSYMLLALAFPQMYVSIAKLIVMLLKPRPKPKKLTGGVSE